MAADSARVEATQRLASFAANLRYDDIPHRVREHCKNLLLDALACAVAGRDHARIPDELIEEYLQWKPLAEPHFQEAVARLGPANMGGSIWSDLVDRAAKDIAD